MAAVKQFSAKQKTAMTWWANPRYQEYDAIICDGAVRSGKTLSMGMGFFLWAMRRFSGEQFALCGKTIVSLRREGFPVSRADNDVADGIRVTANLLKQRKIVICEGCESCLAEIAAYCWEDSGTGRDRPKKERDHAMDEMRYFAVSIAKKERGGGIAMRAVERAAR